MFKATAGIYEKKTKYIALTGAVRGCGTTHFSIAIANYYRHRLGFKVLYMEVGSDESFSDIANFCTEDTVTISDLSGFCYRGIEFYPKCKPKDIFRVPQNDYDVVILEIHEGKALELIGTHRFDGIFICGSIKPWKYRYEQEFLHRLIMNFGHMLGKHIFFGLTKSEKRLIKDEFRVSAIAMPYVNDPFCLSIEEIKGIKKLL